MSFLRFFGGVLSWIGVLLFSSLDFIADEIIREWVQKGQARGSAQKTTISKQQSKNVKIYKLACVCVCVLPGRKSAINYLELFYLN